MGRARRVCEAVLISELMDGAATRSLERSLSRDDFWASRALHEVSRNEHSRIKGQASDLERDNRQLTRHGLVRIFEDMADQHNYDARKITMDVDGLLSWCGARTLRQRLQWGLDNREQNAACDVWIKSATVHSRFDRSWSTVGVHSLQSLHRHCTVTAQSLHSRRTSLSLYSHCTVTVQSLHMSLACANACLTQAYSMKNHLAMVHDESRVLAYADAIRRVACGRNVCDIGSGPFTLLTRLCLGAGASSVTAIEQSESAVHKAVEFFRDDFCPKQRKEKKRCFKEKKDDSEPSQARQRSRNTELLADREGLRGTMGAGRFDKLVLN